MLSYTSSSVRTWAPETPESNKAPHRTSKPYENSREEETDLVQKSNKPKCRPTFFQLSPLVILWPFTLWLSIWFVNLLIGESSPDMRIEMPLSS